MGRFQAALYRFFSGRRGPDQLGTAVIIAALVLSVLASILGWSLLSLLSLVIWAWALYRMLSRNIPAREKENAWFLKWYSPLVAQARQAHTRFRTARCICTTAARSAERGCACPATSAKRRSPAESAARRLRRRRRIFPCSAMS